MGNTLSVDENTFKERAGPNCKLPGRENIWLNSQIPDIAVVKSGAQIETVTVGTQGLHYLQKKVELLPKCIWRAKMIEKKDIDASLLSGAKKNVNTYFTLGTYTLADLIGNGRISLPNENLFWYLVNFIISAGKELEAQMEYHPDISPYSISINKEGDLMLSNPYMNLNYASNMLEVISPLFRIGCPSSFRCTKVKGNQLIPSRLLLMLEI